MYSITRVKKFDIAALCRVSEILYRCGKDMAKKYDLHHWDNSRLKNAVVIFLCVLKNEIYLVSDNGAPVATFQTRKVGDSLLFQKLATDPKFAGGGIGTFCMNELEKMGKEAHCKQIVCEVYDKSEHAVEFYKHRGYTVFGTTETLKYKELKLKKEL